MATFFSFYSSTKALERAEIQIGQEWRSVKASRDGDDVDPVEHLGGAWNDITKFFNFAAMLLFFAGSIALITFLWYNLA